MKRQHEALASLRLTIPLALVAFISVVLAWTLHTNTRRATGAAQEKVLGETNRIMTRLQASLERAAIQGEDTLAQEELSSFTAQPYIELALLTDHCDTIVACSRREAVGRDWSKLVPPALAADVRRARIAAVARRVGGVHASLEHALGYGVYPVRLGPEPGGLRPTRVGILYVSVDLAGPTAMVRAQVRQQLLPFGLVLALMVLGLGLFLHFRVTVRVRRLARVTERFASGDLDARSRLRGADEIGELSRAFDGMAEQLEETQARLRHSQKMEALGRLTTGVAHDFNNLLMGVTTTASVVMRELEPGHPGIDHLRDIKDAVKGGASIVKRMMDFSHKRPVELIEVEVDSVIAINQEMIQRLLGEDVLLEVELGAPDAEVCFGEGQLEQVLLNLAINARDAMPGGGSLRIRTQLERFDQEHVTQMARLEPGHYVSIRVEDTGHGMDAETRERVFEPFFTTKEIGKGTGLGLATVYGIVRAADGSIELESEPGMGTAFTILLGCSPHAGSSGAAAKNVPDPRLAAPPTTLEKGSDARTILLVEDNLLTRCGAKALLEEHGYAVVDAASGEEALALAERAGAIDAVVTDLNLPGLSGPQLVERLRARWPRVPALFVSGLSRGDPRVRELLAQPAVDFLSKPFELEELAEALEKVRRDSKLEARSGAALD